MVIPPPIRPPHESKCTITVRADSTNSTHLPEDPLTTLGWWSHATHIHQCPFPQTSFNYLYHSQGILTLFKRKFKEIIINPSGRVDCFTRKLNYPDHFGNTKCSFCFSEFTKINLAIAATHERTSRKIFHTFIGDLGDGLKTNYPNVIYIYIYSYINEYIYIFVWVPLVMHTGEDQERVQGGTWKGQGDIK